MSNNIPDKLTQQLFMSTRLIHHVYRPQMMHDKKHMHRGQGRLLSILLENDGISIKEIVNEMDIRPSSAGELVQKLEEDGYVTRKTNQEDKRVTNVFLTEKGKEEAQDITCKRQDISSQLFDSLTEQEQQDLSQLLEKLLASLEEKAQVEHDENCFAKGPGHFGRGGMGKSKGHHGGCHKQHFSKKHWHKHRHSHGDA